MTRTDYDNWVPLSVEEVATMFAAIPVQWCFAGGWALDLHRGTQSRPHADVDIVVPRCDQRIVYEALAPHWQLYKAHGTLSRWEAGETIATIGDVWATRHDDAPWSFQLMLVDVEAGQWMYRRERSIRMPFADVMLHTADGVPYMRPEVQLLYKGGGSQIRPKDEQDLRGMLPLLTKEERAWLYDALRRQCGPSHPWLVHLKHAQQ